MSRADGSIPDHRRSHILIASDHRVNTPSVVKPIEEKKVNNVIVEAEPTKVIRDQKSYS